MKQFSVQTGSRTDFVNIDGQIREAVSELGVESGVITVFIPHTTAGVTINENADPDVTADLESIFDKAVPWKDGYLHNEGNSAAHAKSSMMGSSVQIIVEDGRLMLGTWQSVYFCEFDGPRNRNVWVSGCSNQGK